MSFLVLKLTTLHVSFFTRVRKDEGVSLYSQFLVHKRICKKGTKGSIEIKLFEVPSYKVKIPFARVNHAKYMVTEKAVVICKFKLHSLVFKPPPLRHFKLVCIWTVLLRLNQTFRSADYFITTGGISLIAHATDFTNPTKMITDMRGLHERDWFSSYATSIDNFSDDGSPINKDA